jgi:hypothetical protein
MIPPARQAVSTRPVARRTCPTEVTRRGTLRGDGGQQRRLTLFPAPREIATGLAIIVAPGDGDQILAIERGDRARQTRPPRSFTPLPHRS